MAIYQTSETTMYPRNIALDMSESQNFTSKINGSLANYYQDIIRRVDTNAILYDSTKTSISPALYDGDTLSKTLSGGIITYTGQVKWTRTVWSGSSYATSKEVPFYSYSMPVATLTIESPINNKKILLTTEYAQTQGISVQSYQYFLYASDGTTLLESSDEYFTQKLQHEFDGLLDGNTYYAECITKNQYGQTTSTGKVMFEVDYSEPTVDIKTEIEFDAELSAVIPKWGDAIQNIGTLSGDYDYIENHLVIGNYGLQLTNANSSVEWNVDIPEDFTVTFDFTPNGFTSGKIASLYNESSRETYSVSYNGSKFELNIDGYVIEGKDIVLANSTYVLGLTPQRLLICKDNIIIDEVKGWWDK